MSGGSDASVASDVAEPSGAGVDSVSRPRTESSIDDVPTRTVTFESPSEDGDSATAEASPTETAGAGPAADDADDRPTDTTTYDTVRDAEGNVVSSTATTDDADGNAVRVVERTFDAEGNVTSTTYVEYDEGEVVHQGDAPSNAHLFDLVESPEVDLSAVTGTQDASAVMAGLRGDASVASADDLREGLETTFGSSETSTGSGSTSSGTVDSSGGSVAADSVTTVADGGGEVGWEQMVTDPDGAVRTIRGYQDGSIEIERPSKWLEDGFGDDLAGLPAELAETIRSSFTVVERISPDGTRTVREPMIEDMDMEDLSQMMANSFGSFGFGGSPPDLSFLTTVHEVTYAADGAIERTASIHHDLDGDVVYREESVIDGRTTTTTATQYEDGVVVGETTAETTEPEPVSGSTIDELADVGRTDPTGAGGSDEVPASVAGGTGLHQEVADFPEMLGETTVTNDDGTTIVTRRLIADGDVAWEQTITEADGSVRVVRGYDDGSIEYESTSELVELFGPDALGPALGLAETYADHFRMVERIAADGSRTVREPALDVEDLEAMMASAFSGGPSGFGVPAIDPTMFLVIHEADYAADGSVVTTRAIHYDGQLEEAYVEETVHHDDGTTTTTTTQSDGTEPTDGTETVDPVDPDAEMSDGEPAEVPAGEGDGLVTDDPVMQAAEIGDPRLTIGETEKNLSMDADALEGIDGQLDPNLGLWSPEDEASVPSRATNWGVPEPSDELADFDSSFDTVGATTGDDFLKIGDIAGESSRDEFLKLEGIDADSGGDDAFIKWGDALDDGDDAFIKMTDVLSDGIIGSNTKSGDALGDGDDLSVDSANLYPQTGVFTPAGDGELPDPFEAGSDGADEAGVVASTDATSLKYPIEHGSYRPSGEFGDVSEQLAEATGKDPAAFSPAEPVASAVDPVEGVAVPETGPSVGAVSMEEEEEMQMVVDPVEGAALAEPQSAGPDPSVASALGDDGTTQIGSAGGAYPPQVPIDEHALPGLGAPGAWEPLATSPVAPEPVASAVDPVEGAALAEPQSAGPDPSVASALGDDGTAQIGSAGGAYPPQVPIDEHAPDDVEATPVAPEPVADVAPVVPDLSVETDFDVSVGEATFHEPVVEAPQISESLDEPALDGDFDAALGDDLGDGLPGG